MLRNYLLDRFPDRVILLCNKMNTYTITASEHQIRLILGAISTKIDRLNVMQNSTRYERKELSYIDQIVELKALYNELHKVIDPEPKQ